MASNIQSIYSTDVPFPVQPFSLDFHSARLTEKQFEELCRNNPDMKFELSAKGKLIIMPPTSMESGWKNSRLTRRIDVWTEEDGTGMSFDSSTMFTLPNGAKRSPDVSWILRGRVEKLSLAERRRFARIVPDFVIELRSPTDALKDLQDKLAEYIENGVRLGWLIDPMEKKVHVYRGNGKVEVLDNPEKVSGEDVLKGFELNPREIW
ncbi:MAG: Uma2 family endonuclease [Acidobacteria bacterium]|nr:Uma2 family endonuclease [Acidobacteriota bacterium]